MNTLKLVHRVYNSYVYAAWFIGEQYLVTVGHMLQERREVLLMSLQSLSECHVISKCYNIRCSRNSLSYLFSKCGRYLPFHWPPPLYPVSRASLASSKSSSLSTNVFRGSTYVSDNSHIHKLQQGSMEEMQETKRLILKEHSYWSSSLRWFAGAWRQGSAKSQWLLVLSSSFGHTAHDLGTSLADVSHCICTIYLCTPR